MNTCCEQFHNRFLNIGKRGFSIIPISQEDCNFFILQGRSIDYCKQKELEEALIMLKPKVSLSLLFETGIKFCPFCGENLGVFIEKNSLDHIKLSQNYSKYSSF